MKTKQVIGFGLAMFLGIIVGGHIAGHIIFGLMMLAGLVGLVENIPIVKWFVYRTNNFIDIALFIAAGVATVYMGVTITAALTVCGLGYTYVYAPYVRARVAEALAREKEDEGIVLKH